MSCVISSDNTKTLDQARITMKNCLVEIAIKDLMGDSNQEYGWSS